MAASLMVVAGAARGDIDDAARGSVHLSLGPGLYAMPLYPGAQATRTRIFPFIDAEYDNRYYSNASDLVGVYAWKKEFSQAGAAIEFDPTERRARDDARLAHLPDVKDTTRLKLFASRTVRFATAEANVATDVLGRGHGTVALANLWLTAPLTDRMSINVGPGVTWADARYLKSFYAVTPQEAALSSQLSAHSTHSGILDAHWNGLVEWQLSSHYRVGIQLSLTQLKGTAAASPLTEQRTQRTVVGWVAYTFR